MGEASPHSRAGGIRVPAATRPYWFAQAVGWSGYAVLVATTASIAGEVPVGSSLLQSAVLGAAGVVLSHALYRLIHRFNMLAERLPARLLRLMGLVFVLSVPAALLNQIAGIASWQTREASLGPFVGKWLTQVVIHELNWSCVLLIWSALYFGIDTLRERAAARLHASELARALQAAELRLLKSQLNPHFLFNALNTVRALISEDPAMAQQAVTQLARTLRYTLNAGQEELVPLERELAIVEDYLALQALRLGPRLRVERHVEAATLGGLIPVMLLQTLTENAVKHGIAELPEGGRLRISAELSSGALLLAIENDRPRVGDGAAAGEQVGLRNSMQRLQLLFGPRAELRLDLSEPDRATARVRIPFLT